MNCPTCNAENAYVSLFSVECSNRACKHFVGTAKTMPKSKRAWSVERNNVGEIHTTQLTNNPRWYFTCYVVDDNVTELAVEVIYQGTSYRTLFALVDIVLAGAVNCTAWATWNMPPGISIHDFDLDACVDTVEGLTHSFF